MRRGAARGLNDWEQTHLGSYMDDYFDPEEDDHKAEDAYEHGWIASDDFHKEEIELALAERDHWKAEFERLQGELTDDYYD